MKAKKPTMRERFEFIYSYKFSSSSDYIERLKPMTDALLDKVENLEIQHDKELKALEDEIEGWKAENRILNAELEEFKAFTGLKLENIIVKDSDTGEWK